MNPVDYFVNFYTDLNLPGLILFWMIIVLFFFLFASVIMLLLKNDNLRKNIFSLQNELDGKMTKIDKLIKRIETLESDSVGVKTVTEKAKNEEPKKKVVIPEETTGLYQENIFKKQKSRSQTSPVALRQEELKFKDLSADTIELNKLDNSKSIRKMEPLSISRDDYEDEYYNNLNDGKTSFVEEITDKSDKLIKPINLNDYEKEQEDEAIISYQELVESVKKKKSREERYKNIENDAEFLEELKLFRSNL
ncbi:MAG: hypothetical protein Q4G04_05310 [bacterium]|nr:hypothetical protein [bacterium]